MKDRKLQEWKSKCWKVARHFSWIKRKKNQSCLPSLKTGHVPYNTEETNAQIHGAHHIPEDSRSTSILSTSFLVPPPLISPSLLLCKCYTWLNTLHYAYVQPPVFMQPKDDIARFAKYLMKKVYATHRPLVKSLPIFLLLKWSNYSVPTCVTNPEHEILLFFLMSGGKKEKIFLISAFHPRVSCCSPAPLANSTEHASRRASVLWQYVHQRESLNQTEVSSCTSKCTVIRPGILNFLGLLSLQTSWSRFKSNSSYPRKAFRQQTDFLGAIC